jgi:hypothetical protein
MFAHPPEEKGIFRVSMEALGKDCVSPFMAVALSLLSITPDHRINPREAPSTGELGPG